ncbi:MAG: PQQ-binding-like beta-propeller repeat protein [Paracoccus sp. (in: a-proteobacteria)]|nr:PQQ-binding-like beta-propeller repeat protein [Paracoccus sp. (in: a-proteobacteria)]
MTHFTLAVVIAALPLAAAAQSQPEWRYFHGNAASQKYAAVTSFTPENVGGLEKAWEIHTGDVSDGTGDVPATVWSATPIYANGTLYLGTPFYRILALDPATGAEKWSYDTESTLEILTQPGLKNRGVAYWDGGDDGPCGKRVYIGTMGATLHAVDADTGQPCADFGEGGVLDVNQWNTENPRFPFSLLQPPMVSGDQLFLGWSGMDWEYADAPPGNLIAIDARTGEMNWQLHFIPEDIRPRTGTANVWTAMTVDEERGLLFAPVSSPSPNYWGGNRLEPIPLATSVTAIHMDTGEIAWSFQHIYHDLWDYDTPAAPSLVDIERDGETVPALVQPTKQGFLFVLNRETGEPLFPVEERPVPASTAEGEVTAPVQPFLKHPPPTNDPENMPGVSRLADIVGFGQCSRDLERFEYQGIFTPPSEQGIFLFPATPGANNWGGVAIDPVAQRLYVNSSVLVQTLRLIPREEYPGSAQGDHDKEGWYPQLGAPYGIELLDWMNWAGLPCWDGPYGTFSSYDLRTGDLLYRVPFGQSQQWGFFGPRSWGSPTLGGPVVTAGGVVFIGASMDARVRALDAATGGELWSDIVDAPSVANPAVFTHDGVDYVVFVAGGNDIVKPQVADHVAAYRLPR